MNVARRVSECGEEIDLLILGFPTVSDFDFIEALDHGGNFMAELSALHSPSSTSVFEGELQVDFLVTVLLVVSIGLRPYGELRQGLGGFGCRIVGSSPRSSRLMLSR